MSNQNPADPVSSAGCKSGTTQDNELSIPDFVEQAKKHREKQKRVNENSLSGKDHFLLGNHVFGVQFIWDGYGNGEFYFEGDKLFFLGEQISTNEKDFLFLNGEVIVVNKKKFIINGKTAINIADCTGYQELKAKFTFLKSGKRKFWRMQNPEKEMLSDKYTCHYYIDIFE